MFNKINSFAKSSQTLEETRKNVKEMSILKETLIFIVLFILLYGAMKCVFKIVDNSGLPFVEMDLLSLFSYSVGLLFIFIYLRIIEKRSFRSIGISKDNVVMSILKGLAIGFAMFLSVVIIGLLLGQYSFSGFDPSVLYLLIPYFLAFFVQSTMEEMEFRGWVATYFTKRHSVIFGFLMSSIIFVLVHVTNMGFDIVSLINVFIAGVLFSILFWKYDNLWVCASAHAMWNYTQGYLLGFNVSGIKTTCLFSFQQTSESLIGGGLFGPESGLIATFVMIAAIIVALYYPKKSNRL